jgi:hypothetical protein
LTSIDGVTFERAWTGRLKGVLGGERVSFLGRRELIRNKRAAGRPKDLADIALLEEGGTVRKASSKRVARKRAPRQTR